MRRDPVVQMIPCVQLHARNGRHHSALRFALGVVSLGVFAACGAQSITTIAEPTELPQTASVTEPNTTPTLAESLIARGAAAINAERWATAELAYTELLEIEPNSLVGLVNRATARLRLSRFDDARTDLEAALTVAPDDARVLQLAASAFAWLGMTERSAELQTALPPNDSQRLLSALSAIASDDLVAAHDILRELLATCDEPSLLWRAHNALGVVYAERGDIDAAITEFERATELEPAASPPIANHARALIAQGRANDARPLLIRYLEVAGPDVPDRGYVEALLSP